jgi:hypothetical protein
VTRTHVDESELVDIGQDALALLYALQGLAYHIDHYDGLKYLDKVNDLTSLACELSDQVDALCEYIRHSRMLD